MATPDQIVYEMVTQMDFGMGGMLVAIIATGLVSILITRNTKDFKIVLAPVAFSLNVLGFHHNWFVLAMLGILSVTTMFNVMAIPSFISKMRTQSKKTAEFGKGAIKAGSATWAKVPEPKTVRKGLRGIFRRAGYADYDYMERHRKLPGTDF